MKVAKNNQNNNLVISSIQKDSIAEQLGLEAGDEIVSIDGVQPQDYIEYKFLITDLNLELEIKKSNGQRIIFEIEKDYDDLLGIEFGEIIFDGLNKCHNNCIFCFVDQMPPGIRRTLQLKDDDYRFSFLKGSYITLTNLSQQEISRIKRLHLSPLNISVHTTNSQLRKEMLKNSQAGKILSQIKELTEAGIELNTQIVLCPEINDGNELEKTIKDLAEFAPLIKSLAVVPVGLTKYRSDNQLRSFTSKEAKEVIDLVSSWQEKFRQELAIDFVYLADEFYLLAGEEIPSSKRYDDFLQYENGVGMIRVFWDEFEAIKPKLPKKINNSVNAAIITSHLGKQVLKPVVDELNKIDNLVLEIITIENEFFGSDVTVTGLLTAQDILQQLEETDKNKLIILPEIVLNDDNLFLDDISWQEFRGTLSNKVIRVENNPSDLVENILEFSLGGEKNE